jgi:hypothetical protein
MLRKPLYHRLHYGGGTVIPSQHLNRHWGECSSGVILLCFSLLVFNATQYFSYIVSFIGG